MKKVSIIIFFLAISILLFAMGSAYDLGTKQVSGIQISRKPIKVELTSNKIKTVPISEKNIKVSNQFALREPALAPFTTYKPTQILKSIPLIAMKTYPRQRVIMTPGNELYKDEFQFSTGGYSQMDSYKYIIDYYKNLPKIDANIYFHIGRNGSGKTANDSYYSIDNYYLRSNYKNYSAILSKTIDNEDFPSVTSKKVVNVRKNTSNVYLMYKFENKNQKTKNNDLSIGTNYYNAKSSSVNTPERNYTDAYISLYGKKSVNFGIALFPTVNNYATFTSTLYTESIKKIRDTAFNVDMNNTVQFLNNKTVKLNVNGGLQIANNDSKGRVNTKLQVTFTKNLTKNYGLIFRLDQSNYNKTFRDILNGFVFGNDVLAPGKLKQEDNYSGGIGVFYSKNNLYSSLLVTQKNSTNRVIYQETLLSEGQEPVTVSNDNSTLRWISVQFKNSYSFNGSLRGTLIYKYRTINNVPFFPQNSASLGGVYTINNYSLGLNANYYGEMFAKLNRKNPIGHLLLFNFDNTYKLNNVMKFYLNFDNIFDNTSNIKTNYPIAGRKVMLGFQYAY